MMNQKWQTKTLCEIAAEITSGGAAPQGESYFENGTFPFVRVADMGKLGTSKYIVDTKDKLNDKGISKLRLFPKSTILFTKSGASLLLNQRAVLSRPMYVVSHIGCIVPSEQVTSDWLYYWMLQIDFAKYAHATTLPSLKLTTLKELELPVPPLEEQSRIVARIEEMFSQLESGVETLRQTKEQLAVYRQAVLSCAFPELTDTNKKLLMEIADITGGITKGRHLEGQDVIELPYLRVANVQDGYLDLSEMKTIQLKRSEREKYLLQYDDVLYTEGGDRDKLGRGTVWRNEIPECVHQNHIFKARINQELAIPQYVAHWSLSRDARNYFYTKGKQTVNLASINKTVLSNLPLPIPAVKEQQRIVSDIEDRLSICDQIEQTVDTALQQAEALRQSILKKAFEGGL